MTRMTEVRHDEYSLLWAQDKSGHNAIINGWETWIQRLDLTFGVNEELISCQCMRAVSWILNLTNERKLSIQALEAFPPIYWYWPTCFLLTIQTEPLTQETDKARHRLYLIQLDCQIRVTEKKASSYRWAVLSPYWLYLSRSLMILVNALHISIKFTNLWNDWFTKTRQIGGVTKGEQIDPSLWGVEGRVRMVFCEGPPLVTVYDYDPTQPSTLQVWLTWSNLP